MFVAGDLESITVVRPVPRDEFGDPTAGVASETVVDGCLFAPGNPAENGSRFGNPQIGQNQVQSDATVYVPIGTDILPADQVLARSKTFEVIGFPLVWGSAGVEVRLVVVEG